MESYKFSILITTKNRLEDLKITLHKTKPLISDQSVECIICDDGSIDGTYDFIKENYPKIQVFRHEKSKGLIYSRNQLLKKTTALYAISLDDDAHFISDNVLKHIEYYFEKKPNCAVLALRIFWGLEPPSNIESKVQPLRVSGFIGCGHVWRMEAWKDTPEYPSWFVFYGEEDFAAFQLYKKNWEIWYVPEILVHHRVNVTERRYQKDYRLRLRRSLRSGWYLYFLFYPKHLIFKRWFSSAYSQLRRKVFKGDIKALIALGQAQGDFLINLPRLFINSNRLTPKEYKEFVKLPQAKIYWKPIHEDS
jgi:glycosyltransferase involved in cell wall biosynthesis